MWACSGVNPIITLRLQTPPGDVSHMHPFKRAFIAGVGVPASKQIRSVVAAYSAIVFPARSLTFVSVARKHHARTLDDPVPTTAYSLSRGAIKEALASRRLIRPRGLLSQQEGLVSLRLVVDRLGTKGSYW